MENSFTLKLSIYVNHWLIAILVLMGTGIANAQTTYTTTSTNPWSTQVWTPAGTPGPTDNVVIAHNISGNVAISVNNLTINTSRTLTLATANAVSVNGNLSVLGTITATSLSGAFTVGGDLSSSGNISLGTGNFTVTGTTTLTAGSLSDNAIGGIDSYNGLVTINSGATLQTSNLAHNLEFSNGILNNGTLSLGTPSISLFKTNAQSISGSGATMQLGLVNVGSDVTLTNSVTTSSGLIVIGNLDGQNANSQLINGPNALLQYRGAVVPFATAGSLDANTNTNTVNYSLNGAQGVLGTAYQTLIVSGTGTKTVGATDLTVQTALTINPSITLTVTSGNFTLNGTMTLNGTLTDNNAGGTNIFNTAVTINSGATLSSSAVAANFEFTNGIFANGTLNINAAATSLFKTNNQVISGTGATISLGKVNVGSGITLTNNVTTVSGLIISGNLNGVDAGSVLINGSNTMLQYQGVAVPFATAGSLDANTNTNTVNYSLNGAQGVLGTVYRTLILSTSNTKTVDASSLTVETQLTINTNITLLLTSGNFTLNGNMTLNGTLTDNNAGGTNIFNTAITVNSGATLSSAAVAANFEFHNGLNVIGTLNLGTASVSTFKTNNQSITGTSATIQLGSVIIDADIELTNDVSAANGLVIKGNLDGGNSVSEFINAVNRFLNYQGTQKPMLTSGLLTVDVNPNTVRYSGATQTIADVTYHNLEIAAAGTKNISDVRILGNYTLSNGTIVSTGVLNFEGALAATMQNNGAPTYQEVLVNKPGSTLTLFSTAAANFTVNNLTVAAGSLVYGGSFARTITVNGTLSGAGAIDMSGSTHILTLLGSDNAIGSLITDANLSRVNYNRSGDQTIFSSQNYRGLTVGATGLKVLAGNVRVLANLNMAGAVGCLISLGNNDLKIASGANITGNFDANRYVLTNGTGSLIKEATTTSEFTTNMLLTGVYPVGSGGFYTPFTITALTATATGTASISVRAVPTRQPNVPYFNNALVKHWDIETANLSAINANLRFNFNSGEVIGLVSNYVPRVWNGTTLVTPATPSAPGSNPFTTTGSTFIAGEWTAIDPTIRSSLYSYQSGDWFNPNTWTTDPSGNTLVSPMVPGNGDQVVILNGRTVTLTASNDTVASVTINSGGILDLAATTGHSFGPISGEGRMRLKTTTLPASNYTAFVAATGGTIEYYDLQSSPATLSTLATYNNVEITNSLGTPTNLIQNSNITLNGNLNIINTGTSTCTFTVGGDATNRSLTVLKSVSVSAGSNWFVGTSGGTHTINITGSLTNSGTVDFTNGADYVAPANGCANVFFTGTNENTAINANTGSSTTFYGFTTTKAFGYEMAVNVAPGAPMNFVNAGQAFTIGGNGIFRLGPNITIPRIGAGGNYDLGATGFRPTLWIDGATVTDGNVGGALVPYGTLKITSGTFNFVNGQGSVVLRESGVLQIEGGTVNMRIFRTSVTAITHRGAFIMSGGTLNISGDNGGEGGYYAMFSLPYPENVFQMSGGTINITRTVSGGITLRGGIMIGSNDQSYIVTGGTINASITGAQDFDITSTAPFYNFNVSKTGAGAGKMSLRSINWSFDGNAANTATVAAQPLRILNDFNITSTGSPVFDAADQNVVVGGNFTIASSAEMRNGNNVLVFNGSVNQTFTLNGLTTFNQGGGSSFISGSEDIQNGVNWTLEGTTSSVNIESDPNTLFTAERILETAGTSVHRLYSPIIPTSGPTTASIFVKPAGRTCVGLYVGDFSNLAIARYNLTGGGSVTFTNGNVTGSSITAEANGWYRISITSAGSANYRMRVYLLDASCTNDTYAGNTSLGVALWGAKLESGSAPTPYVSSAGIGLSSLQLSKSEGTTLQLAGSASSFNFNGNARILTGTINLGTKTLNVAGAITHNTQITGAAGSKLRLNGTLVQSMAGDGDATIQNLTLDNTGGSVGSTQVAMLSDFTIENQLELVSNRVFSIENNRLTLPLSATIVATSGAFSATKFIRTNGFLSDRGISKTFGTGATSFVFPFGTPGNYTPATLNFGSAPSTWGTLDIRPVAARQLYVTDPNCFELYWRINSTGFSGIPANSLNFTFNYGNLPDNTTYIPAYYNFQTIAYTTINNVNAVDESTNNISFSSFSNLNGDFTAGNPAAFGIVTPYYSRVNGSWNTPTTWSNDIVNTHNGVPSASIPSGNSPVFIGNGTTAFHTVTVPNNNTISGSLIVDAGSTIDLGVTTGNNFGALPYATAGGAGKVRIASTAATAEFPAGDFGLFFTQTGGTTEYYTTTGSYTLPNVTAAPTSMNITTYRNLMLSPTGSNAITLADRDLTIFEDLNISGNASTALVNLNSTASRILTVNGNLNVNGGKLMLPETFAQELLVNGNLTIASGAEVNSGASGSLVHAIKLYGNLTNNGTLELNSGSDASLQMLGNNAANITGTNASALTDLYSLVINKGNSQSIMVECNVAGTFSALENNWLNLQNGTFRFLKGSSITLNSAANSSFLIPETARLSVNHPSAVVNAGMSNTGGSDLIVAGELEIIDGTVNVGDASNNQHNDLEYASTGAPSIKIQNNGVLNVNGQIRRSVFSVIGSLRYQQSGNSTVLVRGKNPDAAGSFNSFRAKFEILNPGSDFAMSGNSLLIIDRAGLANAAGAYGDIYLTPETSTISGGEIRVGTSNTASATVFDMTSTAPFWNLTVDGTITSKTLNNNTNASTILNNLTIGGNSIFRANGLSISIGGSLINQNTNATAAINTGGYQAGSLTQTTFLNGLGGSQTITGVAGNLTNFANLVVQNTAPSGSINLTAGLTNVRVNGALTLQSGDVALATNLMTVTGNVSNDVNVSSDATGYFVMGGTAAQQIGGSGTGSFQNFRMANAAGVEATAALNINGILNFNTGLLYLNNHLLTLGTTATVTGSLNAGSMIRLNGVVSDAGVRKLYPASAASFTFPIGTTLRYTPATLNLTSNSVAGSITVVPVAVKHPATTDPTDKELTAYWKVEKSGLSPSLTVNHTYQYHPNDAINGTEANYRAGRFFNNVWVPNGGIAGSVNAITDLITINGVNYIDGDYTAGETTEFNIITTYYSRNATTGGNWSDVNSWSTDAILQHDGAPCVTPPTNSNIVIAAGHTITCQAGDNGKVPPTSVIDGTLNLINTFGHNFGTVTGTGTVVVTPNASNQFIFPGGNFAAFTAAGGGTFEFNSSVTAQLPTQATYNSIRFSGAGTKRLPNANLQVNGNITIAAGVVSNSLFNKNITLFGDWTNNVGTSGFVAGSGTSNVTLAGVNQTITGATNFYHLRVNSGGVATLNSTITITNRLTFIQGLIATGSNEVVVNAAATVTGGSALSYINGNMRRILPAGVFSAQFDIGDASAYAPALISFTGSIAANGQILARTTSGDDVNIFTSGLDENKSCNRTWTLTPTSLSGFTSLNVKLNFVAGDIDAGANPLLFNGARYSGSSWTTASSFIAQSNYFQFNTIAGLGIFQIGEPYNAIIWTGTVSADWNTAGNWLQNRIPTFADNVVIGNVVNQPIITTGNGSCVDITMNAGGSVTIGSGQTLEVNGNIVSNGTGISGAGTLVVKGSSASVSGTNALFNINTTIQSGATLSLVGATTAEFQKDLTVNGNFTPGSNLVRFSGIQNSTLTSASEIEFGGLAINKANNTDALILNSNIRVNGNLTLISGDLNLVTFTADLNTTGTLVGESATNKVFGTTGVIQAERNLNAPSSVNVAGLGAEITAPDNLGLTTIIRGTEQKSYNAAYGINRYYEIHPSNNSGLNATLVFNYFDDELVTPSGTITESTLDLWRFDGADWTRQFATLNTGTKKLTKTSIPQFSIWTAGYSSNTPLPITLLDFDAECSDNNTLNVTWTTASEIQNKLFEIEQSDNAVQWIKVGEETGASNSNSVLTYRGTYPSQFKGASYLRLKQTDFNGQVKYFDPIYLNCAQNLDNSISMVPNPAADYTELRFTSDADDKVEIMVYSVSGQLLLHSTGRVGLGQTSIKLDLSELPAGIYYMNVNSTNGIQFGGNKTLVKR